MLGVVMTGQAFLMKLSRCSRVRLFTHRKRQHCCARFALPFKRETNSFTDYR